MDPLTVLGLVCNIVALVEASYDAAQTCQQIYKYGASIADQRVKENAIALVQSLQLLTASVKDSALPPRFQSGIDLTPIATKCLQIAGQLRDELLALESSPGVSHLQAVAKFISTKRKAKVIEKLKDEIEGYQKTLRDLVQFDIRHMVGSLALQQDQNFADLVQKLEELSTTVSASETRLAQNLTALIEQAASRVSREYQITRRELKSHVDHGFAMLAKTQLDDQELEHRRQFLDSLRFREIQHRENAIVESFPDTFDWILDEKELQGRGGIKWDSFILWLREGQTIYWLNGKAGSGKSTLMKYVTKDNRTVEALAAWSLDKPCLLLTFYFWLSGATLQRSFKGFLCSLLLQLLEIHPTPDIIYESHSVLFSVNRTTVDDWSIGNLKAVLVAVLTTVTVGHNVCIFIDGADEFDQDEDSRVLLDYLDQLCQYPKVKCCISSRPEPYFTKRFSSYPTLRLQDLTWYDIRKVIIDELTTYFNHTPYSIVDHKTLDDFVDEMVHRADGVFLWVHFALKSVTRGMKNEDDFQTLYDRLLDLPTGMEKLYEQMWQRLNGDDRRYQKEASALFAYHSHFPLNCFEFMLAMDRPLREHYLRSLKMDLFEAMQLCTNFMVRLNVRTAGLLEACGLENSMRSVSTYNDANEPTLNTTPGLMMKRSHSFPDLEFSKHFSLDMMERRDMTFRRMRGLETFLLNLYNGSGDETPRFVDPRIGILQTTRVDFIHRTARDFLIQTRSGQKLLGRPSVHQQEIEANLVEARMVSCIMNPERANKFHLRTLLEDLLGLDLSNSRKRVLIVQLDRVCACAKERAKATLKYRGNPSGPASYGMTYDLRTCVVDDNVGENSRTSLTQLNEILGPTSSSYDSMLLGVLISNSILWDFKNGPFKGAELASWLVDRGASLNIKHCDFWDQECCRIITPAEAVLRRFLLEIADGVTLQPAFYHLVDKICASIKLRSKEKDKLTIWTFPIRPSKIAPWDSQSMGPQTVWVESPVSALFYLAARAQGHVRDSVGASDELMLKVIAISKLPWDRCPHPAARPPPDLVWQTNIDDALMLGKRLGEVLLAKMDKHYLSLQSYPEYGSASNNTEPPNFSSKIHPFSNELNASIPRCKPQFRPDWDISKGLISWRGSPAPMPSPLAGADQDNWWSRSGSLRYEPNGQQLRYGCVSRPLEFVKMQRSQSFSGYTRYYPAGLTKREHDASAAAPEPEHIGMSGATYQATSAPSDSPTPILSRASEIAYLKRLDARLEYARYEVRERCEMKKIEAWKPGQ